DMGEMEKIDGLPVGGDGGVDQLLGVGVIELETRLQQLMQLGPVGILQAVVERGDVDEQGGRGQPVITVIEYAWLLGTGQIPPQGFQFLKHWVPSISSPDFSWDKRWI